MSEKELQREVRKIMTRYKNVFVMCASMDLERLAMFYTANRQLRNRTVVCDHFQKNILEIFTESAGVHTSAFRFDDVYDYRPANTKLLYWMADKGFCMFVRATDKFKDYCQSLLSRLDPDNTVLIYSMWKEYVNPDGKHTIQRYIDFISMFPNMEQLHTSGHASADCLAEALSQMKGVANVTLEERAVSKWGPAVAEGAVTLEKFDQMLADAIRKAYSVG